MRGAISRLWRPPQPGKPVDARENDVVSRNRSHALRAAVSAAVLIVGAAGLSGCASGKKAETMQIRANAALGTTAELGAIAVRDVYVTPAGGGSGVGASTGAQGSTTAYVVATIANSASSGTDTLTGVTVDGTQATPQTAGVAPAATPAPASPSGTASPTSTASPSGTASATPRASAAARASTGTTRGTKASASPSGSPPPTAAPVSTAGAKDLTVGPHQVINFNGGSGGGLRLVVTGLSTPLRDGMFAQVTFTFASAGSVTVQAPVAVNPGTTATATPMPSISLETTTPSPQPTESRAP